jgi:Ca-activated chloride channel homolog
MNIMKVCTAALLLCMLAMAQPSGADTPVSVSVVLDTSGSMGFRLGTARTVASEVLKPTAPLDQVSLVQASDEPAVVSGFESGAERSLSQLEFVRARGGSALLDGIYLGLRQATSGRNERKVLVVISDGGDNRSRYTESEIANAIRESGVRLFIVGMNDPIDGSTTIAGEQAAGAALLSRLAVRTGGGYFNVTRHSDAPVIAAELRAAMRARP